ncbi:MAG: hypothetical protein D084_Lepto4C00010G0003 [Leptospirillum sp. Group IV 'UBA BS']|nr:MAG: hypothetical protein D084_Lepto4C00010G0003 [Leptospirillum sp. Group IV 'UBA BS']
MTDKSRLRRLPALALATATIFTVSSCASFYHFRPLSHPDPATMPIVEKIPASGLMVGIRTYHTAQDTHNLFGHQGLWREHVIPVQVALVDKGSNVEIQLVPDSVFLSVLKKNYHNISPSEAYDIAWQAKVPYQNVEQVLYYTGLFLFTIATLGLGSMIWVLPSPFSQPIPAQTPFGRDLAYKAFPEKATLYDQGSAGGLFYFHLPFNEKLLSRTRLSFQLRETDLAKKSPPRILLVSVRLTSKKKSQVNPLMEILHGFF